MPQPPSPAPQDATSLAACGCLTAFGDASATLDALLAGHSALQARPVLGIDGGDAVPIALLPGRALDESLPARWPATLRAAFPAAGAPGWGSARRPVLVSSSNFGVGHLLAFIRRGDAGHLALGSPGLAVGALRTAFGWGPAITTFSHACVSAHLALAHGSRLLAAGAADKVLVLSFDLLSPFVTGGFHALKILNSGFPAPFADRSEGSIGLGDGAAFAILTRATAAPAGSPRIAAHALDNELVHPTANAPDGSGFDRCLAPLARAASGLRTLVKGHGTGTLDAGRLEHAACSRAFPSSPLVGWKGALGHTLGSCGLVELAIAAAALTRGSAPGTVGTSAPTLGPSVATSPVPLHDVDGIVCLANAFGGAHAGLLVVR